MSDYETARQAVNQYQPPPGTWVLVLSRYERDNLLHLLNAVGWPANNPHADVALRTYNSGDWVGMVAGKLAKQPPGEFPSGAVADGNDRVNRLAR